MKVNSNDHVIDLRREAVCHFHTRFKSLHCESFREQLNYLVENEIFIRCGTLHNSSCSDRYGAKFAHDDSHRHWFMAVSQFKFTSFLASEGVPTCVSSSSSITFGEHLLRFAEFLGVLESGGRWFTLLKEARKKKTTTKRGTQSSEEQKIKIMGRSHPIDGKSPEFNLISTLFCSTPWTGLVERGWGWEDKFIYAT